MFWYKPLLIVAATLIAVTSLPADAHAQRGRGRAPRVLASRPVLVAPYLSPFYDPFYGDALRWGYPGWYGPALYNHGFVDDSAARIQVTPRETEVFVDGYLAGVVDDFDGFAQRLRVSPGEHVIELYLDGHKTVEQTILFEPGETYRIRHVMKPLASGEAAPVRPTPRPGSSTPASRTGYDVFGQPVGRGPAVPTGARENAALLIRVQPGDAAVLIDGERWQGSGNDRLEVQVTPGEHRIEIQKDGYQPFSTTVRVRPGESAPVNVSLTKSGEE